MAVAARPPTIGIVKSAAQRSAGSRSQWRQTMDRIQFPELVQAERNRWADKINREAWMFEEIEQPGRGRLKLATLRRRLQR